jgi:hypothetical protein
MSFYSRVRSTSQRRETPSTRAWLGGQYASAQFYSGGYGISACYCASANADTFSERPAVRPESEYAPLPPLLHPTPEKKRAEKQTNHRT